MMRYLRRYGFAVLVVIACLFPFVFFSSDMSARRELSVLERIAYTFSRPIETLFSLTTESYISAKRNFLNLRSANDEVIALRDENSRLNIQLQVFREIDDENIRLRRLLSFVQRGKLSFISGEVLSSDPSFLYKNIRINRGEPSGARSGMGVVSADGVVGIVMRSDPKTDYSSVLLVTDPNCNIDVIVARNRRRGVLAGSATNKMILRYTDRGGRIQVGDEIVTSGLTGPFPRGIAVGRVKRIEGDSSSVAQRVDVEPSANFSQLSEVLILLQPNREVEVIRHNGGEKYIKDILDANSNRGG